MFINHRQVKYILIQSHCVILHSDENVSTTVNYNRYFKNKIKKKIETKNIYNSNFYNSKTGKTNTWYFQDRTEAALRGRVVTRKGLVDAGNLE